MEGTNCLRFQVGEILLSITGLFSFDWPDLHFVIQDAGLAKTRVSL